MKSLRGPQLTKGPRHSRSRSKGRSGGNIRPQGPDHHQLTKRRSKGQGHEGFGGKRPSESCLGACKSEASGRLTRSRLFRNYLFLLVFGDYETTSGFIAALCSK